MLAELFHGGVVAMPFFTWLDYLFSQITFRVIEYVGNFFLKLDFWQNSAFGYGTPQKPKTFSR